jgi:hypothetical protein
MEVNLPGGAYLRESTYGFSLLLTGHVVFMCLFFGLVIMMDLRLAGLGNLLTRPEEIQKRLFPWQLFGFVMVAVTGGLIFYSKPVSYYGEGYFWLKLGLMVLAGINAGIVHVITSRGGGWDSRVAKVAGIVSLVLWAAVLVTGRLIAYEWWQTDYFLEEF